MKAMLCREFGPIENIAWTELPTPACGPKQIRYRTSVATLGFMDALMIKGEYQVKPDLPYVPGSVSAGVVTEVGSLVTGIKVGQRVSASDHQGAFACERVVGEETAVATPEGMQDVQAAALRLTFTPSYLALVIRAELQRGETLVVTGATGGIGFAAMQLGRFLGARVIGVVGSAAKAAFLQRHGFMEVIDYSFENYKDRVNALTGGVGADVIFEVIGGDIFEQSLRCINVGGRVLVLGFAGGRIGAVPANLPLMKNASIIGSFLGGWRKRHPEAGPEINQAIQKILTESGMKTPISRSFAMPQAADALNTMLDRGNIGQIVLAM
ncbi:MAG: NADPH:quinone oxidoreductase family protein [Betaproteobacteria bacterium]|nr:NADPH:quinone oxidoreductase family protein [Betaproteobacteria bacterium]